MRNRIPTETWVIFERQMRSLLRNPVWVFFGLTQPILYLVLFGPLLKNVSGGGLGGAQSWKIFVPGLLLQLSIFGAAFAGFGIIQELREGVVDRQRVTPASRAALILGRSFSVTVTVLVQAVLLVVVAIPFGLRASVVGVVASLVLVSVLALGIASASYTAGLLLKDEDSFAPAVQGISLPLLLLSGVLLPMTLAPTWLRRLSQANPLTYVVDGARSLVMGNLSSATTVKGLVTVAFVSIGLTAWGVRSFSRTSS